MNRLIAALLLTALVSPASAALITYDVSLWGTPGGAYAHNPGEGQASFDSSERTLTAFSIRSVLYDFEWSGSAPLTGLEPYVDGVYYPEVSVSSESSRIHLMLDLVWANSVEQVFDRIAGPAAELWWSNSDGEHHGAYIAFTKVRTISVPEPSTLALLGLGLAGLAFKRRVS